MLHSPIGSVAQLVYYLARTDIFFIGSQIMNWQEIGKWAIAIVAAAVGGGIIFRFVFIKKNNSSERSVTQNNNRAGRDIIGGDKIDKR